MLIYKFNNIINQNMNRFFFCFGKGFFLENNQRSEKQKEKIN